MEITLEAILTYSALIISWFTFRYYINQERGRIISSIKEILEFNSELFQRTYKEKDQLKEWLNPGKIFYKTDTSTISAIVSHGNILNPEIQKYLVSYASLIDRRNQTIENYKSLLWSDRKMLHESIVYYNKTKTNLLNGPDSYFASIPNEELREFFKTLFENRRIIAMADGLDDNFENTGVPTLYRCHWTLSRLVSLETSQKNFFTGDWIGFFDFLVASSLILLLGYLLLT